MNKINPAEKISLIILTAWLAFFTYQKITTQYHSTWIDFFHDKKLYIPANQSIKKDEIKVTMVEVNQSGSTGSATILDINDRITINMNISNTPALIIQPTFVHLGTCEDNTGLFYQLASMQDGKSSTTLYGVTLNDLFKKPLSIITVKSISDGTILTCGDIKYE